MLSPLRRPTPRSSAPPGALPGALVSGAFLGAVLGALSLLTACAGSARIAASASAAQPIATPALSRAELLWVGRLDFGSDTASLAAYRRLGPRGYLEQQLSAREDALPPAIAARIGALQISHSDALSLLSSERAQRRALLRSAPGDRPQRQQARRSLNQQGNALADEAARRELLRAVYSQAQLREQLVWFWMNHFSVSRNKAELRWLVGDYEETAIRPYALGHFRDLVLATLEHPAMLEYLDNDHNVAGHLNENYARELLELHTLGVGSGYTQQDVQAMAHVLTGAGISIRPPPRLPPQWRDLYLRRGAFEFNPARHDFSPQTLLGHRLTGRGFAEVQQAVTLIVRQPACAQFISRELATYFVADTPPPRLVDAMAHTFQRTDGDIAAVLRTMFLSPDYTSSLGEKFKDPVRYVVSAVRLAYDSRPAAIAQPMLGWLNALGEAPFGHATPDGYALVDTAWSSPGQMTRRFEIARAIGSGSAER
ncbi:MAG TPA: DUF1800 domain-containing protein, partial [Steroidobacteraceae bacterium]|nr:DUF1800 domain-containing protein [Steroidobacteraceae bacterium]